MTIEPTTEWSLEPAKARRPSDFRAGRSPSTPPRSSPGCRRRASAPSAPRAEAAAPPCGSSSAATAGSAPPSSARSTSRSTSANAAPARRRRLRPRPPRRGRRARRRPWPRRRGSPHSPDRARRRTGPRRDVGSARAGRRPRRRPGRAPTTRPRPSPSRRLRRRSGAAPAGPACVPRRSISRRCFATRSRSRRPRSSTVTAPGARRRPRPAEPAPACPTSVLDVAAWAEPPVPLTELAPLRRGLVGEFDDARAQAGAPDWRGSTSASASAPRRGRLLAAFDGAGDPRTRPRSSPTSRRVVDGEPRRGSGPARLSPAAAPGVHAPVAGARRAGAGLHRRRRSSRSCAAAFEGLPLDFAHPARPRPDLAARRRRPSRRGAADPRHHPPRRRLAGRAPALRSPSPPAASSPPRDGPTGVRTLPLFRRVGRSARRRRLAALVETALTPACRGAGPVAPRPPRRRPPRARHRGEAGPAGAARRGARRPQRAARGDHRDARRDGRPAGGRGPRFGSLRSKASGRPTPQAVGQRRLCRHRPSSRGPASPATPPRDPARRRSRSTSSRSAFRPARWPSSRRRSLADDPAARLIAAEAEIGRGGAKAAEATVGTIAGAEAAVLRARALHADGDYSGRSRR